jgi:hypothetical protein
MMQKATILHMGDNMMPKKLLLRTIPIYVFFTEGKQMDDIHPSTS